jgi:hypothetical protein
VPYFLRRPGAADHPLGAAQPGDLPGDAAHGAGGAGDEDRLSGGHPGDVQQAGTPSARDAVT